MKNAMKHVSRCPHVAARTARLVLLVALAGCGTPGAAGQRASGPRAEPPRPDSAPPAARAALASCPDEIWPADGAGAQAIHLGTHEGVSVFALSGRADAIVAVGKLRPEEPDECSVQHVVARTAPAAGAFWLQAGATEAVLLRPEECHPAFCPSTLLVRSRKRAQGSPTALGAWFWPEPCDVALTATTLRWFPGQDSVQLTCHQSTGAAHREIIAILHVLQTGPTASLAPVFTLDTGTAESPTQEERETPGFCPRKPVGWVRLAEQGERPRIQVFDPARGQPGEDGKGTGLLADFRFDPGTRRFEQITPGTLQDYDARAWCQQE